MKILFKNKKFKMIIVLFIIMTCCVTFFHINSVSKSSAKIEKKYLQAGSDGQDIDVNSIELTAHLNKLTNIHDYNKLKSEMSSSNENQIMTEALKRGIMVKQGIVIDIDKFINLSNSQSDKSDNEIVTEAIKQKIIKNYGDNSIESINIEKIKELKAAYPNDTDEEIVNTAIKKEIIKGKFNYSDLKIDTNLDLNTIDISQFGNYNMNDFLSLSDIKKSDVIQNNAKTIKEVGIEGGQIEAQYKINLLKNPLPQGDDSQVPMDIVILIDTASDKDSYVANALNNFVFRNPWFVNNAPTDANIIVMPYHIDSARRDPKYYYNQCNHNNYSDDLQQMIVKFKDDGSKSIDMSDTIDRVYKNAKIWFDEKDQQRINAGKTITSAKAILNVTNNISDEEYKKCCKNGNESEGFFLGETYNVITIYNSLFGDGDSMDDLSKPYNSNAKKLHILSGGVDKTYYVSYVDKKGEQSRNDINTPLHQLDELSIGEKVSKDLLNSIYSRFVNTKGKLNFNLGKDIRLSADDKSGAEKSVINGEQKISLSLSNIKLRTDYSILADQNIKVSSEFLDDMKKKIIDSTFNGEIHNEKILQFLQDRLSDLNIIIDENDVKIITDGMYENIMNKTIEQINIESNYSICKLDNTNNYQSGFLKAEDYLKVKNMKVLEILKLNYDDSSNSKYLKLYSAFYDLIGENLDIKINKALGKKIEDAYKGYSDEKQLIVNGILNGTDVTNIIKTIKNKSDAGIAVIINDIKKKFNSDSTIKAISLSVSTDTMETIKVLGKENDKLSDILKYVYDNNQTKVSKEKVDLAQEDIRYALRQLVNVPLGLTQTTYTVEEENNNIKFIVEPTLNATFDESKNELYFVDNINTENPENNYINYTSTSNSGSITKNTAIDDTPILVLNRILTSKNHIIYKEIGSINNDYGQNIMVAKAIDEEGIDSFDFAKDSVVTMACNVRDITGSKNIELEINYQKGNDESNDLEESLNSEQKIEIIETPKLYKYNYDEKKLDYIGQLKVNLDNENKYSIMTNSESKTDYIILYSMKTSKDNCQNVVRVSGLSKGSGTLNISSESELPNLY